MPSQVAAIEVIANSSISESNLNKSQLRRIYTMRQLYWSDHSAIHVFVLPSQHELHRQFAKEQLRIFPYQLNRIWHKLTYSGLGVAPTVVASEKELIQAIINTPGAIGYISDKAFEELKNNNKIKSTMNFEIQNPPQSSQQGAINVINIQD